MPDDRRRKELKQYAEEWGILFELLGSTRMMGKILGWLLVCDPPEQSARDIAEAVGASAGSVSTGTRTLVQAGMVERVGIPGKRSAHFRVSPGMWGDLLSRRMGFVPRMARLADRGLRLVSARDEAAKLRLKEIRSYCRYVERELPRFIEQWEKEWRKESKS